MEPATGDSLSARMAQRASMLRKQRTEWFPVPGWADLLEVELRAVPFEVSARIVDRNQRVRDPALQKLYITADTLLVATMGFRQLTANGPVEIEDDWGQLAQRLPDCPDAPTRRQAMLFLVPSDRLLSWSADYQRWADQEGNDVDREVAEDFGPTG
jgi:hypothetical protein